MPALAIDTATEEMAIAIGENEQAAAERSLDAGRSHLELLLPAIHVLLGEKGLAIGDIDSVVVGTGPGTFSGLRVGVATARALAQTLELPLYGFSTLESLALELVRAIRGSDHGYVLPLIDAKRGQVFAQLYKKEGEDGVTPESDVLCQDPELVAEKVSGCTRTPILAGGNGAVAYREALVADSRLDLLPLDSPANRVRATWHLRATTENAAHSAKQLLSVVPVYVREPDADKTILLRKREPWLI